MRIIRSYADRFVREEAVVEVRAFDDAVREKVIEAPHKDPIIVLWDLLREGETSDELSCWHEREGKS